MRGILIATFCIFGASTAPTVEVTSSGSDFQEACRFIATDAPYTRDMSFKVGFCAGDLTALAWVASQPSFGILRSCPPKDASLPQLAEVAVSYLDRHPSRLRETLLGLILSSFAEVWPCAR
jgi:hypothetical protein